MGWVFDRDTHSWKSQEDQAPQSFNDIANAIVFGEYRYDPEIKGWRDSSGKIIGGGVKLTKERVHLNTDGTVTHLDSPALQDIRRRLKEQENSKTNANGGWDPKSKTWKEHKSHEGGENTVAYGLKLIKNPNDVIRTRWIDTYNQQGYLTDRQAEEMLDDFSLQYLTKARETYDGRYGQGSWDRLSDKSQSILTDYQYNGVLNSFKNLMDGFYHSNLSQIYNEHKRYSNGEPLTQRNNSIKADLDSISNGFYTITK